MQSATRINIFVGRLSLRTFPLLLCIVGGLIAQAVSQEKSSPIWPPSVVTSGRPKLRLTPTQKLGLQLLNYAQSEASALQPDMRAFVLWQASYGQRKIDPTKASALLKDALRVTLSIDKVRERCMSEAELCGTKYWLQKKILQDIITHSKEVGEIEPLLATAEPEVRQMVRLDLFPVYIREKEFEKARNLLNQMADEDGYFCYSCATKLMDALPKGRSQDRSQIFSQAVEAYNRHPDERYPTSEDFAMMVLRSWRDLPPSSVLGALDQIFDRAKEADHEPNMRVGVSAAKGDAYFSSVYEFRIYQLMPVLEQLDQERAASLLRDNQEVQIALERYPQGLESMNALPGSDTRSGTRHIPGILSMGTVDTTQAPAEAAQREITRQQSWILGQAEKDPKQALSAAMGLPVGGGSEQDYSPRASTLNSLARIVATRDPAVSKAALGELRKIADSMSPRGRASILADLPETYLRLGDEDEARASVKDLIKVADKLYGRDSDVNDPNQAFKGMWPSANLWRHCVALATKLDPTWAEEIIREIPDPEIKAFERITLANSLLGASVSSLSIVEKHKTGISASIGL